MVAFSSFKGTNNAMSIDINDLVLAPNDIELSRSASRQSLIRIRRGIYLPANLIPNNAPPWKVRRLITQARAVSLTAALCPQQPPVLTLEAALAIHGLPSWINTADICYRRDDPTAKKQPHTLPFVELYGVRTPPVCDRRLVSRRLTNSTDTIAGIRLSPLWEIAVDCARYLHPMAAVVGASSCLRKLARFDKHNQSDSRKQEQRWRVDILKKLDGSPRFKNSRKVRKVLEIADAGIETPGEGYLLWLMHCIIPNAVRGCHIEKGLTPSPAPEWLTTPATASARNLSRKTAAEQRIKIFTQYEIIASGRQYFGDLAIRSHKIIIEFDGGEKIQNSRARIEFLERQRNLLNAGWSVVRIDSRQLSHPQELIDYLISRLSALGIPVRHPQGSLWSTIPRELLDLDRRY